MKQVLAVRIDHSNPNHHLWNNNGTWFIHYTVHPDSLTAIRIRQSLKTASLEQARRCRDQLLARVQSEDTTCPRIEESYEASQK